MNSNRSINESVSDCELSTSTSEATSLSNYIFYGTKLFCFNGKLIKSQFKYLMKLKGTLFFTFS